MYEYIDAIKKCFVIDGRTSRRGYWIFVLFYILFGILIFAGLIILSKIIAIFSLGLGIITLLIPWFLYCFFIAIAFFTITIRRLHDINKSGWWIFIGFIPVIGFFWLLFLSLIKGDDIKNEYGEVPVEIIGKPIQWRKIITVIIFVLLGIAIVLFFVSMINDSIKSDNQKKVNEANQIRIEEEINSVILPVSFIIERVRNGINKGGDVTDFSEKLTFIDNILIEGEYFYNIKEGPHCTNNSNNCIHNEHCVVANGQWSGDDECRGQSPTIKDIKQNLRDTMMYVKSEELDKCPPSEYVTCYRITEIK